MEMRTESMTEITLVTGNRTMSRRAVAAQIARQRHETCMSAPGTANDESWARLTAHHESRCIIADLAREVAVESAIAEISAEPGTSLREVICVVEASGFFDDILEEHYFAVDGTSPTLYVAQALRMVQHIEHASALLVTDWAQLDTRDLSILLAALSHLAPAARIRLEGSAADAPPTSWSELTHQPGWVHVLNSEHEPHMTDIRVSSFRYEQIRPFHPGRLHRLLESKLGRGTFGAVLRSAGFCRLATRPGILGSWEHVGQMISLEPLARDDDGGINPLSVGQELAFIGIDLDHDALRRALDAATLTDAELTAGPRAWSRFADPFPQWIASDA